MKGVYQYRSHGQTIVKEYYEQHYAHKFEMEQFLQRHNLLKLTEEEIDNLNRTIYIKEVVLIIDNITKKKAPVLDEFTGEL